MLLFVPIFWARSRRLAYFFQLSYHIYYLFLLIFINIYLSFINIFCRNNLSHFSRHIRVCKIFRSWNYIRKKRDPRATVVKGKPVKNLDGGKCDSYFSQGVSTRLKLEADRYSQFLRDFLRPLNLQVGAHVCLSRFLSFALRSPDTLTSSSDIDLSSPPLSYFPLLFSQSFSSR